MSKKGRKRQRKLEARLKKLERLALVWRFEQALRKGLEGLGERVTGPAGSPPRV